MSDTPLLSLDHVRFAYPRSREIFTDLSLCLRPGERLGLSAPNGAGKTTLFRLLTALERPLAGRLLLHGKVVGTAADIRRLRRHVGVVLQQADDQLFCPTVLEDVAFGPLNLGAGPEEARKRAAAVLAGLGLESLADRLIHQLSGGEKKLVSLAGVLVMEPEVILLDEPSAGLDPASQERLTDILAGISTAVMVISHERRFLQTVCRACVTIREGRLTEPQSPAAFFAGQD